MFPTRPRPVPSPAALRRLYQLAYISSGTCLGIATLCAEERRRRCNVLQKVADNARRLRQVRRAHGSAQRRTEEPRSLDDVEEEGEGLGLPRDWGEHEEVGDVGGEGSGDRSATFRAPDLPSRVERGYGHLAKREERFRKVDTDGRHGIELDQSGNSFRLSVTYPDAEQHLSEDPSSISRWNSRSPQKPEELTSAVRLDRYIRSKRLVSTLDINQEYALVQPGSPPPEFLSASWSTSAIDLPARKEAISKDIELFFSSVPWTDSDLLAEAQAADKLMYWALRYGSLEEIRSLCLWKINAGVFTRSNVETMIHACPRLAERFDHQHVFDFYLQVVQLSSEFVNSLTLRRFKLCFAVTARALEWEIPLGYHGRSRVLLEPVQGLDEAELSDALFVLTDVYRTLKQSGEIDTAANLLYAVYRNTKIRAMHLLDDAFVCAAEQGHLSTCQKLVEIKDSCHDTHHCVAQYDILLEMCERRKAYRGLDRILKKLEKASRFSRLIPWLSPEAVSTLATACALQPEAPASLKLFDELFQKIPARLRSAAAEARSATRLQELWRLSRNIAAVRKEYDDIKAWQRQENLPSPSLTISLELVMVEILIAANQPDNALELLKTATRSQPYNATTLCLAAVSRARKGSWEVVDKITQVLTEFRDCDKDPTVVSHLNKVVHYYSQHHDSTQMWRFVTALIAKTGIIPNKATSTIVLDVFVSDKRLDLIPLWMKYLRRLGTQCQMDARLGARLLRRYYIRQRPPHSLLMWYCSDLVKMCPSFDPREFTNLLKMSLGYSLRKLDFQDKALGRRRAEIDLERLQQMQDVLPTPVQGYTVAEIEKAAAQWQTELLGSGDSASPVHVTEQDTQSEDVTSPKMRFYNLRPAYEKGDSDEDPYEDPDKWWNRTTRSPKDVFREGNDSLVQEMMVALSTEHYRKVLDLYHTSLSKRNLPTSPFILEVAVEACIRLDGGNDHRATEFLDEAEKAGMNTACATGPILLSRIENLSFHDKRNADLLRTSVADYYQHNAEHGWAVNHAIGTLAASTLINHGQPRAAIDLLNAIYHSDYAHQRPLDIVAMTVFLQGYAALDWDHGIKWVVQTVLQKNLRIDRAFLDALKHAQRSGPWNPRSTDSSMHHPLRRAQHAAFIARLRAWRKLCIDRRASQRHATKVFGRHLMLCIMFCQRVDARPSVNVEHKQALEDAFFGKPIPSSRSPSRNKSTSTSPSPPLLLSDHNHDPNDAADDDHPLSSTPLHSSLLRIGKSIRWDPSMAYDPTASRSAADVKNPVWLGRYRAFYRKHFVMPDGKELAFTPYLYSRR